MESKYQEHYSSLVGFWNDWYQAYVEADFPRLIIRHEDMLWHGEKVTGMIAECAGLSRRLPFTFGFGASKWHGWSANLPKSLGKLQEPSSRQALTPRDAEFAQRELNAELMELFHYT